MSKRKLSSSSLTIAKYIPWFDVWNWSSGNFELQHGQHHCHFPPPIWHLLNVKFKNPNDQFQTAKQLYLANAKEKEENSNAVVHVKGQKSQWQIQNIESKDYIWQMSKRRQRTAMRMSIVKFKCPNDQFQTSKQCLYLANVKEEEEPGNEVVHVDWNPND